MIDHFSDCFKQSNLLLYHLQVIVGEGRPRGRALVVEVGVEDVEAEVAHLHAGHQLRGDGLAQLAQRRRARRGLVVHG